jgi:hypothetical protein
MTDHKKKGDFHKTSSHTDSVGGNKKSGAKPETNSRTGVTPDFGVPLLLPTPAGQKSGTQGQARGDGPADSRPSKVRLAVASLRPCGPAPTPPHHSERLDPSFR